MDVEGDHASRQLARPLERLALYLHDEARRAGCNRRLEFGIRNSADALLANHPSPAWGQPPAARHSPRQRRRAQELARRTGGRTSRPVAVRVPEQAHRPRVLLVGGESDVENVWPRCKPPGKRKSSRRRSARGGEPALAASAGGAAGPCRLFVGHDSGISHLAAAVGVPCVLSFRADRPGHLGSAATGGCRPALRRRDPGPALPLETVLAAVADPRWQSAGRRLNFALAPPFLR